MKEQLELEKAGLEKQIQDHYETIKTAHDAIYWLKKRVKLIEKQIESLPKLVIENALSKDQTEKR
jgi:hypothetical protein